MTRTILIFILMLCLISCGGGGASNNVSPAALAGDLDASFGNGGIVRTGMSSGPGAMTLLSDGKFEVMGKVLLGSEYEYVLTRYESGGRIDSSFGNGGKITLRPAVQGLEARDMVHQQDGKVVIVGTTFNGANYDIHVVRFLADGTPDSAWGDRGQLISSIGASEIAYGVTAQLDGKIIVTGTLENVSSGDFNFLVVRFNADGSLDETFGAHGIVQANFGSAWYTAYASALYASVQPDGKTIIYGTVSSILKQSYNSGVTPVLVLARYESDGAIDASFGTDGFSANYAGSLLMLNHGRVYTPNSNTLAIDSQGRRIFAESKLESTGYIITITRSLPDGSPDLSFGTGGMINTHLSDYDYPISVLVQDDGKILVEGSTRDSAGSDSLIFLRYMP